MNLRKLLPISLVALGMVVACGQNNPSGPAAGDFEEHSDGIHEVVINNEAALKELWYDDGVVRTVDVTVKANGAEQNKTLELINGNLSLMVEKSDVLAANGLNLTSTGAGTTKVAVKYYDTVKVLDLTVTHKPSTKEYYEVEHEGTLEDPFTNEDALKVAKKSEQDGFDATKEYYFAGTVESFYHQPGSRTDMMCSWFMTPAHAGGEKFEIYKCQIMGEDGKQRQWTEDDIWVGAGFVAHGPLAVYNGQYETSAATIDEVTGTKPVVNIIEATVAEAVQAGHQLQHQGGTIDKYAITGYVVRNSGKNYWMADTKTVADEVKDTELFELYGVTDENLLKGAKVKVTCTIKNYIAGEDKTQLESGQVENGGAVVIELLQAGQPWVTPLHEATVAGALEVAKTLAAGETTADLYQVSGLVKEVTGAYSAQYGNISFTMVDAAEDAETLTVFRLKCTEEESAKIVAGAQIVVKGNLQNYVKNDASTYELVNGELISVGGEPVVPPTPEYIEVNAAGALAAAKALQDNEVSEKDYKVSGLVKEVTTAYSAQYGNISFTMVDAMTDEEAFTVYRLKCTEEESAKIVAEAQIVVLGKLKNYVKNDVHTYEMDAGGTLVSVSGGTTPVDPEEPTVTEVNVAGALEATKALADGAKSEGLYQVSGLVKEVTTAFNPTYGNISFTMVDTLEDAEAFTVYRLKVEEAKATEIVAGAAVVVKGYLKNYVSNGNHTYEMDAAGELISVTAPETPIEEPTATEVNVAQALAATKALADNTKSEGLYQVSGLVKEVTTAFNSNYGNISFTMVDAMTDEEAFTVYRLACTEDDAKSINAGAEIVVKGYLKNYVKNDVHTYEMDAGGELVSVHYDAPTPTYAVKFTADLSVFAGWDPAVTEMSLYVAGEDYAPMSKEEAKGNLATGEVVINVEEGKTLTKAQIFFTQGSETKEGIELAVNIAEAGEYVINFTNVSNWVEGEDHVWRLAGYEIVAKQAEPVHITTLTIAFYAKFITNERIAELEAGIRDFLTAQGITVDTLTFVTLGNSGTNVAAMAALVSEYNADENNNTVDVVLGLNGDSNNAWKNLGYQKLDETNYSYGTSTGNENNRKLWCQIDHTADDGVLAVRDYLAANWAV